MHIEKIQQNNAPRVPELIMQALVKAIEDGHIRVGEDMPSERDLAEMLGVGRGSLRECLAILEFLGAIDSRGNRKVLLRDADYIQKARTWIECSNEMGGTEPFNEFRRVIEVGIVGLACERATEEDMAVLDEAIRNLDEDPANYMHDVEFHDALAVASHNAMLASTIHLVNRRCADAVLGPAQLQGADPADPPRDLHGRKEPKCGRGPGGDDPAPECRFPIRPVLSRPGQRRGGGPCAGGDLRN